MSWPITSGSTSSASANSVYEPVREPPSVRLADTVARALRRILPTSLLRLAYRAGHTVMNLWWMLTSPASTGAKVVVTRGDELLLIRLTYGERKNWDLPGGAANHGESPEQTAARELSEEVGLAGEMQSIGSWHSAGRGRQGVIYGFQVEVPAGVEPVVDEAEVAEARWFSRDQIPSPIARGSDAILKAWIDA